MVDAPPRASKDISLEAARAHCTRLARSHYENFTVLSFLTPPRLRPHRAALYVYCRTVDDLGDESSGDRLEQLDRFEEDLDAAFRREGRGPVFTALADTIARFDLPREPFARLIEANRIDQRTSRYETHDDVVRYCAHSADPVGRLVLMLHGHQDDERFALSDAICTGLQLANFWQDIARDLEKGRIYLPREDMARFDVPEDALRERETTEPVRKLIRFQVDRTRALFEQGLPLIHLVRGRLRAELALFARGGLAVLDAIEKQGFDTLRERPTISASAKRRLIASTLIDLVLGRRQWI